MCVCYCHSPSRQPATHYPACELCPVWSLPDTIHTHSKYKAFIHVIGPLQICIHWIMTNFMKAYIKYNITDDAKFPKIRYCIVWKKRQNSQESNMICSLHIVFCLLCFVFTEQRVQQYAIPSLCLLLLPLSKEKRKYFCWTKGSIAKQQCDCIYIQ